MHPLSSNAPDFSKNSSYSLMLIDSYKHWTGQSLIETTDNSSMALYHAPFALVSHGIESDPVFCYANLKAQELWGIGWKEFIHMPSRLSAEPVVREERQRLLDEASSKGYVDHYEGIRISRDGKRFRISDTLLWEVIDNKGTKHGQAARINR